MAKHYSSELVAFVRRVLEVSAFRHRIVVFNFLREYKIILINLIFRIGILPPPPKMGCTHNMQAPARRLVLVPISLNSKSHARLPSANHTCRHKKYFCVTSPAGHPSKRVQDFGAADRPAGHPDENDPHQNGGDSSWNGGGVTSYPDLWLSFPLRTMPCSLPKSCGIDRCSARCAHVCRWSR